MHEKIKEEIKKIVSEGWTDGMAVLWGTPSKSYSLFSGVISGSDSVPITENTVYDLASVTKLFFMICILMLVERGTLSLDACVGDYSTLFPNISNLKIYELMNFSKLLQTSRRIDTATSYDEAVSILHDVKFINAIPRYSDMGAIILCLILNEIPGASFRDLLSEVKTICNLNDTYFWDELPSEVISRTQSYDKAYILQNDTVTTKNTPVGFLMIRKLVF